MAQRSTIPDSPLSPVDMQLIRACTHRDIGRLREALAQGASVTAMLPATEGVQSGKTALHIAAQVGFNEGVKLLRNHGADVDAPDGRMGNTPLMLTMANGHHDTFRLLLDMGADLLAVNNLGYTAVEACLKFDVGIRQRLFGESIALYEALPERQSLEGVTHAALFAPNEDGYCLMDSPRMLRRFAEMDNALEKQGQGFSREELEAPRGKDGQSILEKLCVCGKLKEGLAALNRQNVQINGAALFDAQGNPGTLLRKAAEWGQLNSVFSLQNWKGQDIAVLDNTLQRMPAEMREQITNMYQLRTMLEARREQQVGRGR